MERRRLEVLYEGENWVYMPWSLLKSGDIFRLFDPDESPVSWENDGVHTEFVALGDPVEEWDSTPFEKVWSISALPRNWENEEDEES